jgi:hypothetical protein
MSHDLPEIFESAPLPSFGEGGRSLRELPGHLVRLLVVMIRVALDLGAECLAGQDGRRRR